MKRQTRHSWGKWTQHWKPTRSGKTGTRDWTKNTGHTCNNMWTQKCVCMLKNAILFRTYKKSGMVNSDANMQSQRVFKLFLSRMPCILWEENIFLYGHLYKGKAIYYCYRYLLYIMLPAYLYFTHYSIHLSVQTKLSVTWRNCFTVCL